MTYNIKGVQWYEFHNLKINVSPVIGTFLRVAKCNKICRKTADGRNMEAIQHNMTPKLDIGDVTDVLTILCYLYTQFRQYLKGSSFLCVDLINYWPEMIDPGVQLTL